MKGEVGLHHRDTESAEVTQRINFCASSVSSVSAVVNLIAVCKWREGEAADEGG
jgi:hypothetical protein